MQNRLRSYLSNPYNKLDLGHAVAVAVTGALAAVAGRHIAHMMFDR